MRRTSTYIGQQVYEWLFSAQAQYTMTALAKVCAAMLGTNTIVNGLACTPTTPASMTVKIGQGELYSMQSLEATPCGTLPADTTDTILKQGIQLGSYTTAAFTAPTSTGQSINYLIEAAYADSDISLDPTSGASPVVLQFYNAANPTSPWSGPSNSGATSNTFRDGAIAYQIKAGAAATTGSQITPTPDAGWTGLWVVTVAFGATSITSGNIGQYSGAPFLTADLLTLVNARALLAGSSTQTFSVAPATQSNHAVNLGQFGSSLAIGGYTKLPNGLIIQWGQTGVSGSGGPVTVTFPIAFPNGLYALTLGAVAAAGSAIITNIDGTASATGFPYSAWNTSNVRASGLGASYVAFGH